MLPGKTIPHAVWIYDIYPLELSTGKTLSVCHTVEADAQVGSASQSLQAVPHCVSLKLVGALIPMLPWRHLVNLAFLSL